MKRLFVTGATGYIGLAIAERFRREGFLVRGMTRSKDGALKLQSREIEPFFGDLSDPAAVAAGMKDASIIVHAAADHGPNRVLHDRNAIAAVKLASPDLFLYTSGCWIHGNTETTVNEQTPPNPLKLVSWRPEHESAVLALNGVILRPGFVYGRTGGMLDSWCHSALQGVIRIVNGENRWTLVQIDDLAEAFFLALKSNRGEVYEVNDGTNPRVKELVEAIAMAATKITHKPAAKIEKISHPETELGSVSEGLAVHQSISNEKIQKTLGWRPKHSFFDDLPFWFESVITK